MKANSRIIQLDTLAFLSCAKVVGGKKGTRNYCFPIVFLQVHRALITPTHMLVRAYSAHLSQNATSISAHLNLPTYRFYAAAYKGLVIQLCTWHSLTVIVIISGCNY